MNKRNRGAAVMRLERDGLDRTGNPALRMAVAAGSSLVLWLGLMQAANWAMTTLH